MLKDKLKFLLIFLLFLYTFGGVFGEQCYTTNSDSYITMISGDKTTLFRCSNIESNFGTLEVIKENSVSSATSKDLALLRSFSQGTEENTINFDMIKSGTGLNDGFSFNLPEEELSSFTLKVLDADPFSSDDIDFEASYDGSNLNYKVFDPSDSSDSLKKNGKIETLTYSISEQVESVETTSSTSTSTKETDTLSEQKTTKEDKKSVEKLKDDKNSDSTVSEEDSFKDTIMECVDGICSNGNLNNLDSIDKEELEIQGYQKKSDGWYVGNEKIVTVEYRDNCRNEPLSCESEIQRFGISEEGYKSLIENLENEDSKIVLKSEKLIKEHVSPSQFIKLIGTLEDKTSNKLIEGMQCKSDGILGSLGCFFNNGIDIESKAIENVDLMARNAQVSCNKDKKCTIEEYNQYLDDEVSNTFNDYGVECDNYDDCKSKLESNGCKDLSDNQCIALKTTINRLNDVQQVETNIVFDMIQALKLDPTATKAAKLFGFEADYNNVPVFLKETIPSQLCMGKIEGYLDKEIENGGGVTQYGCTQSDNINPRTDLPRENTNPNCLEVLGDLRAQRTQITPDGNTAITYSAYLRAPSKTTINYIVAVSYIQNGNTVKIPLTEDVKNTTGTAKIYEHINFPINTSLGEVDEKSFKIGLLATYKDKSPYLTLTSPIILIEAGDYYEKFEGSGFDNSNGNEAAQQNSNQLTTDDLLSLMN